MIWTAAKISRLASLRRMGFKPVRIAEIMGMPQQSVQTKLADMKLTDRRETAPHQLYGESRILNFGERFSRSRSRPIMDDRWR